jgi:hypothetical protein
LPTDPFFGSAVDCATSPEYETGLAIEKSGTGTQVTIAALGSEDGVVFLTN